MIRILIAEPSRPQYDDTNPYIMALDLWKMWMTDHQMIHLPAGSERTEVPPSHWCVQSYNRTEGWNLRGRHVCFNEVDSKLAMLFKLTWG